MSKVRDIWYVRFPDGQVVRAKSTASVRRHLEKGRIPFDCRVRRSGQYEWITLEWAPEFADLLKQPAKNEKPEPKPAVPPDDREAESPADFELHAVGVRGLAEELIAALDSTLNRGKLTIAAVAGFLAAAVIVFWRFVPWQLDGPASLAVGAGVWLVVLAIFAVCTSAIGQISVIELSQLRTPTRRDVTGPLFRTTLRLLVCWLIVGGGVVGAVVGLRELPAWLHSRGDLPEMLVKSVVVVSLLLEVALCPIVALGLLLGPIIVVEDCSAPRALRQWLQLLRPNLSLVFLYEALTAAVGFVAAIPFLTSVYVGWSGPSGAIHPAVTQATLLVFGGLLAAPLVAYLIIANVFIYLNLRYEFSASAK